MADPYQNSYHHGDGYQAEYQEEEDAASDDTEGHDEDDQMYEGEYQGIPHPDEVKAPRSKLKVRADQDEDDGLAEQYEEIIEDCGHGRFQWSLFVVLGLALMADSVECFVVALALPSAEKDMCMSNAEKGMLGKSCINVSIISFLLLSVAFKMQKKKKRFCLFSWKILFFSINFILARELMWAGLYCKYVT